MQRLLPGAESVEQVQGRLSVVPFVVPLQQDVQRNGDLAGLLEHGARDETPGEQNGGRDARLDHRQPDPDADHSPEYPTGPPISGSDSCTGRSVTWDVLVVPLAVLWRSPSLRASRGSAGGDEPHPRRKLIAL